MQHDKSKVLMKTSNKKLKIQFETWTVICNIIDPGDLGTGGVTPRPRPKVEFEYKFKKSSFVNQNYNYVLKSASLKLKNYEIKIAFWGDTGTGGVTPLPRKPTYPPAPPTIESFSILYY